MQNAKNWIKPLLYFHLLVCFTWLYLFRAYEPRWWAIHLFLWSIFAIQFSWGFTVGLIVGPARKDRSRLWWSLLTIFMPMWFFGNLLFGLFLWNPLTALVYLSAVAIILGSETYAGVLLGARLHSEAS